MHSFFRMDGPLFMFLNKAGNIILASLLWLVGCVPVVTIGVSTSALYYCVTKSIRSERGYVWSEFWTAYKGCLKRGGICTLFYLAILLILWLDSAYAQTFSGVLGVCMQSVYLLLFIFIIIYGIYLFPMLSRFSLPLKQTLKMVLVSVFKYLPYTIGCCLIMIVLGIVAVRLPLLAVLSFPGLSCFLLSFLLEPVMREYIPEPETEEEKNIWYYQLVKNKK